MLVEIFFSGNKSGSIAERSRACICSGFMVGDPGSNPAWRCFFLNKKKFIFRELDGEPIDRL